MTPDHRRPTLGVLLLAALSIGCEGYPDLPHQAADAPVRCRPDSIPPILTLEEAIDRVDEDGDGMLTADDLRPGEAVVILSVHGIHLGTGTPAQEGFSIHRHWRSFLSTAPADTEYWVAGVLTDCWPGMFLQIGFGSMEPAGNRVAERTYPRIGMFPDIPWFEIVGSSDRFSEGTMTVSHVGPTRLSGHLNGIMGTSLMNRIPVGRAHGQQIVVHAFAFRDIIDAAAVLNEDR